MNSRVKQGILVLVALVVLIQLWPIARTNPATNPSHTVDAVMPQAGGALAVLNRACSDCHSNATVWPWYSRVAPVSWLVAHDVAEGREAVNFSEWGSYDAARQQKLLKETCSEVRDGEMPPWTYTPLHPESKLTPADVDAVCSLAPQGGTAGE